MRLVPLLLIFLIFTSLCIPGYSLNLQSKQISLLPNQETPFKILETFGFTEFIQTTFQEDPTQTIANLFAYYIDGRVLQNFVSTIFDRSQENNLLSYQKLALIIEENGLTEDNTPRVLDLVSLDEDSKVDFSRFETVSNILFHEALSLVTYLYIIEDKGDPELATGLDLWTVEEEIRKVFAKLGNIYPAPRCEELEYLFEQADKDNDKKLNLQEFHYLLSIFLTYYRAGIKNNEYAAIIFQDDLFEDLWEKEQQKEQEHTELVDFSSASFSKFLQMALHDEILSLVGHILFSKFDEDGSGLISSDEFKTLLGLFGSTDAEIELIFAATDANQDGNIDFSEFLKALETFARRLTAEFGYIYLSETQQTPDFDHVSSLLQGVNQADLALISEGEVQEIFNRFDDGDGVLDQSEFRNFIAELITYWKKKIDTQKDEAIKGVAGLDPTDENIQQIIDTKQENQNGSTDDGSGAPGTGTGTEGTTDAATDLVDQVTKDTPLEDEGAADDEEEETEDSDFTEDDHTEGDGTDAMGSEPSDQEITEDIDDEVTKQELTEVTEPTDEGVTENTQPEDSDDQAPEDEPSEITEQEIAGVTEPSSDAATEEELTEVTEQDESEFTEVNQSTAEEITENTPSEDVDDEVTEQELTEVTEPTDERVTETTSPEDFDDQATEPSEATEQEITGVSEPASKAATEEELTEVTEQDGSELTEVTQSTAEEITENTPPEDSDDQAPEDEPSEINEQEITGVTEPSSEAATEEELTEVTGPTSDELTENTADSEPVDDQETESDEEVTKVPETADKGATESLPTETVDKEEETEETIASEPTEEDLTGLTKTVDDGGAEETDSDDETAYTGRVLKFKGADFNGDGLTDFIKRPTSFLDKTNSQVYLSKGDGTFNIVKLASTYSIPEDLTDVYIGDFNGDGYSDFLRREKGLWGLDKKDTAQIFFSNGDGTFKTVELPESYYLQDTYSDLSFGDFNGDGKTDFIRQEKLSLFGKTATLYLSKGDGTFSTSTIGDSSSPLNGDYTNIIVGDFNGDGKSDFIRQEKSLSALDNSNSATLFTAIGNGKFKTTTLPSTFNIKGSDMNLYVGDFNGDGNDDFLSQQASFLTSYAPGLYISDGKNGFTFQSLKGTVLNADTANIHVGNFDGDNKADFIVQLDSESASPNAYLYLTAETSPSVGFVTYVFKDFEIPGDETNLLIGDYDGDGKSDFIRQEKNLWALDSIGGADLYFSKCKPQSVSSTTENNAKNVFKHVDLSSYDIKGTVADLVVSNTQGN